MQFFSIGNTDDLFQEQWILLTMLYISTGIKEFNKNVTYLILFVFAIVPEASRTASGTQ